jgi:hypothetical protein
LPREGGEGADRRLTFATEFLNVLPQDVREEWEGKKKTKVSTYSWNALAADKTFSFGFGT